MVWDVVSGTLEAAQNAILITFGRVFDFIFGFQWAEGDSLVWAAIGALVIVLLFA